MKIVNFAGFRAEAQKRLPSFLFEYIDGGSYDEHTLTRNVEDFKAVTLRQRVLRDVSNINTSTRLFGRDMAMPLALAPIGIAGFYRRRGEVQAVRAAEAAGVPIVLSTMSCCAVEEVRAASARSFWMQLYMIRDRGFMKDLMARIENAGDRYAVPYRGPGDQRHTLSRPDRRTGGRAKPFGAARPVTRHSVSSGLGA